MREYCMTRNKKHTYLIGEDNVNFYISQKWVRGKYIFMDVIIYWTQNAHTHTHAEAIYLIDGLQYRSANA